MEFRIPEPCPERWDAMAPREDGRYCGRCDRTVIDFTRFTRSRAEAFLLARPGLQICAHLAVDRDTGEAWFPPEAARAPFWAGGIVLLAALSSSGCSTSTEGEAPARLEEIDEPDLGSPMEPLDPNAAPPPPRAVSRPVPHAELDLPDDSATPTPEQRRRTAQKLAARHPVVLPPNVHVMDGMIAPIY